MDLRRIRYALALWCLVMTVVLITYKLTNDQKPNTSIVDSTQNTTSTGEQTPVSETNNLVSPTRQMIEPNTRADLSTTLTSMFPTVWTQVKQWSNPYLLIDNEYLIPLSTTVYDGAWTGVVKITSSPLIIYYRYELPSGQWFTYLYELTNNSSRELWQLIMVGKVWQVYLFSIRQSSDSYRGLSAIIEGSLTTLYTGDYTTAQYLWDTIKLNNSQEIYLPLRMTWS